MIKSSAPLGEFELIQRYFQKTKTNENVLLGIGDDCAIISCNGENSDSHLAISTDMLVEGRHFLPEANPRLLGHKCLAVNLSDLAAMGAKPMAFTLAIALPSPNPEWLSEFSAGLLALADEHQCALIGGDTTAGPLTISITVLGSINPEQALRRSNAKVDDDIWLSHTVGDARLALGVLRQEWSLDPSKLSSVAHRMHAPTPRVALGQRLLGLAHAAVDVSDGLLGDLSHILQLSDLHAEIDIDEVPASDTLKHQSIELKRLCTLMGGDDYELCFTAPQKNRLAIEQVSKDLHIQLTRIGKVTPKTLGANVLRLIDAEGCDLPQELSQQYLKSFDHFK
ncbi:MAG: thiamine-monophosphate kinase [Pseudomonadota bacterium]|jgi:thiamine-monophosphate kinase